VRSAIDPGADVLHGAESIRVRGPARIAIALPGGGIAGTVGAVFAVAEVTLIAFAVGIKKPTGVAGAVTVHTIALLAAVHVFAGVFFARKENNHRKGGKYQEFELIHIGIDLPVR
jgi:hypothetical protein